MTTAHVPQTPNSESFTAISHYSSWSVGEFCDRASLEGSHVSWTSQRLAGTGGAWAFIKHQLYAKRRSSECVCSVLLPFSSINNMPILQMRMWRQRLSLSLLMKGGARTPTLIPTVPLSTIYCTVLYLTEDPSHHGPRGRPPPLWARRGIASLFSLGPQVKINTSFH